ncbi:hypothetical protein BH09SUM1_BH09SUM1_09600 [soil metagenome]
MFKGLDVVQMRFILALVFCGFLLLGAMNFVQNKSHVSYVSAPPVAKREGAAAAGQTPASVAIVRAKPTPAPLSAAAAPGGLLNLNKATQADLEGLPGIGPSKAAAIIQDREQNGLFHTVAELDRVKGFGEKAIAQLGPLLTVGDVPPATPKPAQIASRPMQLAPALPAPDEPVHINKASIAELETLKGVGPKLAEKIVAQRAAAGPFKSPRDLSKVKGIGPAIITENQARIRYD